jgi:sigma-B regulation protein RsbU (phosphoserine phosphatase)
LKEAHRKVEQEMAVAWRIQESFLPGVVPHLPGWALAASLQPARQTSGDFYDFIPLPGGRLGLLVADVADKGTGAALYMALSRTVIRTYAAEHPGRPARALAAANRRILADTQSDLFVTVFYGVLDPAAGRLTYCNAGHNPPYLLAEEAGVPIRALDPTGMALGILDEDLWEEGEVELAGGDLLALYSDGITEAQDSAGTFYGNERLQAALVAAREGGGGATAIHDALLAGVRAFVGGAPQFDDMTLMVLVRDGPEEEG